MYDKDFKVKLISSKNSFLFLSEYDSRQIDHEHMIRLSYGLNKRAFFSLATSMPTLQEGELAMSSVLAKELGIIRNDVVNLTTTPFIASIRRLKLLTASEDDYEMLVVLAENVQSTLLNQVKIVHNQQKLVIWISNSIHVTIVVDGVEPISPGKLEMLTEVAILPPQTEPLSSFTACPSSSTTSRFSGSSTRKPSIMNTYNQTQCALRLHPAERMPASLIGDKKSFLAQPFCALLSRRNFARLARPYRDEEDTTLVTLRIISPPADIKDLLEETQRDVDSVTVRVFCIDDKSGKEQELMKQEPAEKGKESAADIITSECNDSKELNSFLSVFNMADAIYVNQIVFDHWRVGAGAKVIASWGNLRQFIPKSIGIVTTSKFFNKADELVRNYLCSFCHDGGSIVINSGVVMEEPAEKCRFMFRFIPPNEQHMLVKQKTMRECKFMLSEVELVEDETKPEEKMTDFCLNAANFNKLVVDSIECLKGNKSRKVGSGKTSLVTKMAEFLGMPPSHFYVESVSCRRLKGKTMESMQKILNSIFLRLIYYQPSVLILDDLHIICEKVIEGEQPTQENLHFNKVSDMLSQELEHLWHNNCISLIATTETMSKLNKNIYSSRGKHLFKNCYSINDLNKDDRITLLKHLFTTKEINVDSVDFKQLGIKTEGYLIQDLHDLVNKIVFEVYKTTQDVAQAKELVISDSHCETALKNVTTLSLRDVQLHAPGERDFGDVGGLEDVKKILIETMLWPAQYSNIFGNSPLRLQSGVLLYGPPGTGKTLLAGAAAKQCNLRLISVKGPELLSKYIGASEQAVRDVFEKAQSAKPCILFFDEFDSLAPRRGHDNTGVTDRVVNQFLTQLDGVESLSGVCVLAATSRPDLLDPALLRPGRLDRQILCPIPDNSSRLAILKSLAKKLNLHKNVSLEKIVDQTEGFSGADLQAVLYTAQLNSVDHLLQDTLLSTKIASSKKVEKKLSAESQMITQEHLENALKATRPSLTKDKRLKYERIYQKFQGKSDILESLKAGKQKATLA